MRASDAAVSHLADECADAADVCELVRNKPRKPPPKNPNKGQNGQMTQVRGVAEDGIMLEMDNGNGGCTLDSLPPPMPNHPAPKCGGGC